MWWWHLGLSVFLFVETKVISDFSNCVFSGPTYYGRLLYPLSALCMVKKAIYFISVFLFMRWSKQPVLFWKDVKKQNYSQKFLVYLTLVDKHKVGVILPHGPPSHTIYCWFHQLCEAFSIFLLLLLLVDNISDSTLFNKQTKEREREKETKKERREGGGEGRRKA